jgi:hypothetical protein
MLRSTIESFLNEVSDDDGVDLVECHRRTLSD